MLLVEASRGDLRHNVLGKRTGVLQGDTLAPVRGKYGTSSGKSLCGGVQSPQGHAPRWRKTPKKNSVSDEPNALGLLGL